MMYTKDDQVGKVVSDNFRAAEIFQKFEIDFCCGGKATIERACNKIGIEVENILNRINNIHSQKSDDFIARVNTWDPLFLIDFIEKNHHTYTHTMLPIIETHAEKVSSVHGDTHPENIKIYSLIQELIAEMLPHLLKEENILFPLMRKYFLHQHEATKEEICLIIERMEEEHNDAGNLIEEIKKLSNNFTPPDDACRTYKIFYEEMNELYHDIHQHVHLENNVLFKKFDTSFNLQILN